MIRNSLAVILFVLLSVAARGADLKPISPDEFASLHKMIKPQPGESLFWQVPWLLSLDEALERGAKDGKPILIWCGAGGAPHTVC